MTKKNIIDKFENDKLGCCKTPTRWRNVSLREREDFKPSLEFNKG